MKIKSLQGLVLTTDDVILPDNVGLTTTDTLSVGLLCLRSHRAEALSDAFV